MTKIWFSKHLQLWFNQFLLNIFNGYQVRQTCSFSKKKYSILGILDIKDKRRWGMRKTFSNSPLRTLFSLLKYVSLICNAFLSHFGIGPKLKLVINANSSLLNLKPFDFNKIHISLSFLVSQWCNNNWWTIWAENLSSRWSKKWPKHDFLNISNCGSVNFFLIFSMATKWDKHAIFPGKYSLGILDQSTR